MAGRSSTARRLLVVGVCALSLLVCCGLAWWQWQRFSSANGTFQNLGYVLQWPLFGIAPAYMFWRWRKLRDQEAAQASAAARSAAEPPSPVAPPRPVPAVPGSAPEDDELAEYNRYLARLNRPHQAEQETR